MKILLLFKRKVYLLPQKQKSIFLCKKVRVFKLTFSPFPSCPNSLRPEPKMSPFPFDFLIEKKLKKN